MIHLKDADDTDVFIEVLSKKVDENKVGRILNYYSIIANLDPQLKSFRFIVVGAGVDRFWMWFYSSVVNGFEVFVCWWVN